MIHRASVDSTIPEFHSFSKLMQTLGETFAVRDVMVPSSGIGFVAPGDEARAKRLVSAHRYSVVPISDDGQHFAHVYSTVRPANDARTITSVQPTSVADYIPDSTPLAEAFFLFESREWYFTLRGNKVSGLITYWAFNRREFRVQLYAGFSRIEELSRDLLANDGCGVSDSNGLKLTANVLEKAAVRFERVRQEMGGNRFVDELQFHQVHDALRAHTPWRDFLHGRVGRSLSNNEYNRRYDFTGLRDGVMHGRVLFPVYSEFTQFIKTVDNIAGYIEYLDAYMASFEKRPEMSDSSKSSQRDV
jgi:hypothetical protein